MSREMAHYEPSHLDLQCLQILLLLCLALFELNVHVVMKTVVTRVSHC